VLAKFNVVDVRDGAFFEDGDHFVPASIERSHTAGTLVPDDDVLALAVNLCAHAAQRVDVRVIHSYIGESTSGKVLSGVA
jgi:hypothetical protein